MIPVEYELGCQLLDERQCEAAAHWLARRRNIGGT
jgi:hypothetical protein